MAEPYLGEIRLVAFNRNMRGWMACEGQLLPISSNQALYSLLGNRFGGDARVNFQLPDLRGRTPLHAPTANALGTAGGVETVALTLQQVPTHTHAFQVSSQPATVGGMAGAWYAAPAAWSATSGPTKLYAAAAAVADITPLYPGCLENSGGSQPHSNMQPYLALKYIIATQGIYPPRPD